MTFPIEVRTLRKSFKAQEVLHGIDLAVPAGSVFALLGRNGAGKSTTLRLLLGLLQADSGDIRVLGKSMPADRLEILAGVGSMIENPSLYEGLTARENLQLDARLRGLDQKAIDQAMAVVELEDTRKPVRHFSMGMKQRLSLALAVLGQPRLLLLDEPTNGLDPMGIADMRRLLRDLPQRLDTTVLLSTHLLGEVEQVATHLAVLEAGEICFSGSLAELRAGQQKMMQLQCEDLPRLYSWLNEHGIRVEQGISPGRIMVAVEDSADAARLLRQVIQAGFPVFHAAFNQRSLEDIYFEMIGIDVNTLEPGTVAASGVAV